uniref:Uncharacterized protein n=1 Tax=Panagrolaimus sp. ES5 TaxID=591445 RepID=A0AC34GKF5_9BILA
MQDPRCGQIYCIDLQDALIEIGKIARDKKINEALLKVLHEMVRENHVFSELFKTGSVKLAEAIADALDKGKETPRFRLTIVDAREEEGFTAADSTVHAHRAEKPRNELSGMIWCNDDGDPPDYKDVWLDGYKGETEPVPYWSPNVDALCYALLFPHGNQMYRDGLVRKKVEVERAKKRKINTG